MDFHHNFSLSLDEDFLIDEMTLTTNGLCTHHQTCKDVMEQMTNRIKRLEKRIRYLEKNLVECKKENKKLRRDNGDVGDSPSSNTDHIEKLDNIHIRSHAASLRVLRDLTCMFDSSKEVLNNSESSGLMDLVRSLHYLSVSAGLGKGIATEE
jgi:chromosome segregation ATPase